MVEDLVLAEEELFTGRKQMQGREYGFAGRMLESNAKRCIAKCTSHTACSILKEICSSIMSDKIVLIKVSLSRKQPDPHRSEQFQGSSTIVITFSP